MLVSPLRYPGGKGCLKALLSEVIALNDLRGCSYYEPYAGGAGAALALLKANCIAEAFINDADVRIGAFWESVLEETARFVDEIFRVPLSMEEWRRQREICASPKAHTRFQIGFAAFYMNRCNRSGVLTGAGPIGGYAQAGRWKMGVRFNRKHLAERVASLSQLREHIHISNRDALEFLRSSLPKGNARKRILVYLDPPYVNKGQRLYLNSYEARDHTALARYICKQTTLSWVMSYDDTDLIRQLYGMHRIDLLPIRYSLQTKRNARELLITPHRLCFPKTKIVFNNS